jgi:hypothetical protein
MLSQLLGRTMDLSDALITNGYITKEWPHPQPFAMLCADSSEPMTLASDLSPDDWRRICDALRYLGRDLHHRCFAVGPERRELLWEEMDRCLNLADRLAQAITAAD